MFGFGFPSLQNIMIVAIAPVLVACLLVNWRENIYTIVSWLAILIFDLLVLTCALPAMYKQWEADNTDEHPRRTVIDEQPTRANDNMPRIQAGGLLVHSQNVARVRIDCIAKFNQIILTQIDGGLDVDMTENRWVKRNNGAEQSEWVRIGGTGPTEWRDMIERGIKCHAYKRVGGQNKCVPDDRAIIRSLSRGYPLPL